MEPDNKDIEQAELDSYMDHGNAAGDAPSIEDKRAYLLARYQAVRQTYKTLLLQKLELEKRGENSILVQIQKAFSENYAARKYCVRELRAIGEKLEDRFVPG